MMNLSAGSLAIYVGLSRVGSVFKAYVALAQLPGLHNSGACDNMGLLGIRAFLQGSPFRVWSSGLSLQVLGSWFCS